MSKKQLSMNLIANSLSFSVGIGLSFVLTPFLIEHIGKEAYGFYPLANNFVTYINLLVIALNSMAARFIMIEYMKNEKVQANIYFNSVFYSNILIVFILILPLSLIILYIDKILNIPRYLISDVQCLFSLIFATFIVSIIGSVFNVATLTSNRIDLRSYQDIIQNGLRTVLFIVLFSSFAPSIIYIGVINLSVAIIGIIISIYFTKRLLPEISLSITFYNKKAVRMLLGSGIWNSFNQLSVTLLTGLDLLLANLFLGAAKAGEYSIAQTMPLFVGSLIGMLAGIFVPPLTSHYVKGKINGLINEIIFSGKVLGIIISVPISGFIVFAGEFYRLWVPKENYNYLHILSILIIAPYIISGSINILFNVNTIINKVRLPSIVLFCTGFVNVILVLILLKFTNLGLLAIPISSSILGLIRNLTFTPLYSARCLNVKWNTFYWVILRNLLTMAVLVALFYLIKCIYQIDNWGNLLLVATVCGIVGILISLILMLNYQELRRVFGIIFIKLNRRSKISNGN